LQAHGSGALTQWLLANNLVERLLGRAAAETTATRMEYRWRENERE
jgi:hypothetical protein